MKILCFGDSNTYGYDPRSYFGGQYGPSDRWPDVLAALSGWQIVNAGENGREIPHRPWELEHFQLMMTNQAPVELLLVFLGINDLLQGNPAETVSKRMDLFLRQIPLKPSQIILMAPPAMRLGAWVNDASLIESSVRLAQHFEALAGLLGIRFINAQQWEIPMTFDGVHFTEEGHRTFAANLYSAIKQSERS